MATRSKTRVKSRADKAIGILEKINKSIAADPKKVQVGLPKGSNNYPDGTSVIMVGAVHEFGSPANNVPQRSYLRSTMQNNRRKYKALFKKMAKNALTGKEKTKNGLSKLGLIVTTDVKDKITDLSEPPLRSRSGNPLVDTGHLRQAITYEITDDD